MPCVDIIQSVLLKHKQVSNAVVSEGGVRIKRRSSIPLGHHRSVTVHSIREYRKAIHEGTFFTLIDKIERRPR